MFFSKIKNKNLIEIHYVFGLMRGFVGRRGSESVRIREDV